MTGISAAVLGERGIVEVSGATARDFLQGLITVDLEDLEPGTARNAALLTPQGKILFEFLVMPQAADRFLLDTPRDAAAELARRLLFYRLRARIEIAERPELTVAAAWGGSAPPFDGAVADPRLAELGWRLVVPAREAEQRLDGLTLMPAGAYHIRRIRLGIAEFGRDYDSGTVFPHEANLDQLGGVAFDKGCFVGQEVVSRIEHRGTARSRFVPVTLAGPAPARGAEVTIDGKASGSMGSSAEGHGLALLRLDRVADALTAGAPIIAGEATLTPVRPDWARFAWPGAAPAPAS